MMKYIIFEDTLQKGKTGHILKKRNRKHRPKSWEQQAETHTDWGEGDHCGWRNKPERNYVTLKRDAEDRQKQLAEEFVTNLPYGRSPKKKRKGKSKIYVRNIQLSSLYYRGSYWHHVAISSEQLSCSCDSRLQCGYCSNITLLVWTSVGRDVDTNSWVCDATNCRNCSSCPQYPTAHTVQFTSVSRATDNASK